jgi:hypothetical protein
MRRSPERVLQAVRETEHNIRLSDRVKYGYHLIVLKASLGAKMN